MDLWVVAAAAGAGYIAKNIQNLSSDRKGNPAGPSYNIYPHHTHSGSRNVLQQLREKTCPLRRLAREAVDRDDSDIDFLEVSRTNSRNKEGGMSSTSLDVSGENLMLEEYKTGWNSEDILNFDVGGKRGDFRRINGKKLSVSKKCLFHSSGPLTSLGRCLDENKVAKTCSYSSVNTVKPLLDTDATQVINEPGHNPAFSKSEDESTRENESKEGPGTMLLLITGMAIGILSATTVWKMEVDKLNQQLKQMQNLVQDLHDELDLKDNLMVTDLKDEGYLIAGKTDTPHSVQEPVASPSEADLNKSQKNDGPNAKDTYTENLELMSKIEAELEAELEVLENNMRASSLERMSSVFEPGPDFEPDIVPRQLKPKEINSKSDSNTETIDTTPDNSRPANYSVSPWELSFRLHELIKSRLENRINELETALADIQTRFQIPCSDSFDSCENKFCYYSETESSSSAWEEHGKREDGLYGKNPSENYDQENMTRSTCFISDEDFEGGDESDMLLIKQIVERRKMGYSSLNFEN